MVCQDIFVGLNGAQMVNILGYSIKKLKFECVRLLNLDLPLNVSMNYE